MAIENTPLNIGGIEIGKCQKGKKHHDKHIGQYFLQLFFCYHIGWIIFLQVAKLHYFHETILANRKFLSNFTTSN